MPELDDDDPAENLYKEGNSYDWKQDQSPAAATLARANFQQAAAMGHKGAVRALAHLIYEGRGGVQDKEQALMLLWSAFTRGDQAALEELADLLASYAESGASGPHAKRAAKLSETLEALRAGLNEAETFMQQLRRERTRPAGTR